MEATTTVEAWPLGVDMKQKPLYAVTASGVDPKTVAGNLLVIARGLEETDWWSVYKLGSGTHLFDTYVPLVQFSISREFVEPRYVGLQVPDDDDKDGRLRAPNVAAVLTYASADRVIREALITCDNPKLAQLLRSFADTTRKLAMVEQEQPAAAGKKAGEPSRTLKLDVQRELSVAAGDADDHAFRSRKAIWISRTLRRPPACMWRRGSGSGARYALPSAHSRNA